MHERWKERLRDGLSFPAFVLRRFGQDDCLRVAASLSYTSLLALVPLLTIAFAIFSAFPVFEEVEAQVRTEILGVLVPHAGANIDSHVAAFIDNTRKLTGVGIAALGVTALLLFVTIENAFNRIWRVKRPRGILFRLTTFWAILTLAPLLIGASLSLNGQLQEAASVLGADHVATAAGLGPQGVLRQLIPLALQIAAFSVIFILLPNRRVTALHAVSGAVVAAVFFQLLKFGFGQYVRGASYETVYGALATLPLFLIWMYLSWAVVLLGAVVTASVPEWRIEKYAGRDISGRYADRLERTLAVLGALRQAHRAGRQIRVPGVAAASGLKRGVAERTLETLQEIDWARGFSAGAWMLARDLGDVTLNDLCVALGMGIPEDSFHPFQSRQAELDAWRQTLHPVLDQARRSQQETLGMSVAELLDRQAKDRTAGEEAAQ